VAVTAGQQSLAPALRRTSAAVCHLGRLRRG